LVEGGVFFGAKEQLCMENFKFFALAYLNDWWQYDRNFVAALSTSQSRETRVYWLSEAAKYYQVNRRFPGDEWKRFGPLLDLLDEATQEGALTESNVVQTVQDLAEKLGSARKPGSDSVEVSAASKFLWIRHKTPAVIYDDRAYKCLTQRLGCKIPTKDWEKTGYKNYHKEWIKEFDKREYSIRLACSELIRMKDFSPDDETEENLKSTVTSRWFFERVFDKFLWWGGVSQLRVAVPQSAGASLTLT
jgi:hypothetical protein